jgi:S1-C subfamily serine protease
MLENHFYESEEDDQTGESEAVQTEEVEATTQADDSQISYDSEELEKMVEQLVRQKSLNIRDYQNLYSQFVDVVEQSENSLVSVIAVTKDIDWFDTQYESEGTASGLIVKKSDEVLILTDSICTKAADSIEVKFVDGKKATAKVQSTNTTLGFAILQVQKDDIKKSTWSQIDAAEMGSSQSLQKGTPVLVIGSPEHSIDSMGIGYISAVCEADDYGIDWTMPTLTTNISVKGSGCSFLLDMEGKVVGIYPYSTSEQSAKERQKVLAMDGIIEEIQALQSGKNYALFGVKVQEVTSEIVKEYNVPTGLYVTSVTADSPAYDAGIQSGDVIVQLNEETIETMAEFKAFLQKAQSKEEITAVVKRSNAQGYSTMDLTVVLGKR